MGHFGAFNKVQNQPKIRLTNLNSIYAICMTHQFILIFNENGKNILEIEKLGRKHND